MARKEKRGLDYYNIETDIFQNRKIRRLLKAFGAKGYLVYSYLITEIYRDKGCFLEWDENTAFDVSDALNEKQSLVSEIVSYCCNTGLFNKELFKNENVLTARNIQEFWVKVSKSAKRKCSDVDVRFNLVSSIGTLKAEESTLKTEFKTVNREESTQSKVKESKVKKSIIDRKADFKKSLHPFLEKFGSDLLNEFYKYWTEHGERDRKMRFEKEKSFNINLRLEKWLKNSIEWGKEKNSAKKEKKLSASEILRQKHGISSIK